jgi:hypothetical protein
MSHTLTDPNKYIKLSINFNHSKITTKRKVFKGKSSIFFMGKEVQKEKVIYFDKNERPIDPKTFLEIYRPHGIDTDTLNYILQRYDYSGNVGLTHQEYESGMSGYSLKTQKLIESLVHKNNTHKSIYLRGRSYYAGMNTLKIQKNETHYDVRDRIANTLSKLEGSRERLVEELEIERSMEGKLLGLGVLDHRRHLGISLYGVMHRIKLENKDVNINFYNMSEEFTRNNTTDFYQYLFGLNSPKLSELPNDLINFFRTGQIPDEQGQFIFETTQRNMAYREFDNPALIAYYSGNVLQNDTGKGDISLVINPLFGATEIGHALLGIYTPLGIQKINEVGLMRYSLYSTEIPPEYSDEDLFNMDRHVPKELKYVVLKGTLAEFITNKITITNIRARESLMIKI